MRPDDSQTIGIFLECLPDDPALCSDKAILKQNKARLRFYERFGVQVDQQYSLRNTSERRWMNARHTCFLTAWARPERWTATMQKKWCMPYSPGNTASSVRKNITPGSSTPFVTIRSNSGLPAISKQIEKIDIPASRFHRQRIALIVNEGHDIHHIHERGYVEAPVRISSIRERHHADRAVRYLLPCAQFPEKHIKAVHKGDFVEYLKRMCQTLEHGKSVYPYVFPIRNATKPPKEMPVRAGYYCIDTFTPLTGMPTRRPREPLIAP